MPRPSRTRTPLLVWGVALVATFARPVAARADEPVANPESSRPPEEPDVARLSLILPLWLPFLAMESSTDSEDTDESEEVETESEVAWVAIGSLEAIYKSFGVRADVFGIGFEDQLMRRNGMVTEILVKSAGIVGRGIFFYEFGPFGLGKPGYELTAAPLAGARYNWISLETGERADLEGTYDWFDPLLGGRTEFRLEDFRVGAHVDLGGFNIGSKLAFWAALTGQYMIAHWLSVWLGWQHYQVLFEQESGDQTDSVTLFLTGPSAGLAFHVF